MALIRSTTAVKMSFLLNGEDRDWGGNDLFVDLIPSTSFFSNVRTSVRPRDWNKLRHLIYNRANNRCECCAWSPGESGRSLEAHERWNYNNRTGVQKLMRIIALCKMCHTATHMGLAEIRGVGERAREHLMRVTGMNRADMLRHCESAARLWSVRSERDWMLDLSIITDSGFELKPRPVINPDPESEGFNVNPNGEGHEDEENKQQEGEERKIPEIRSSLALRLASDKHVNARLLGSRESGNKKYFRIELTINRRLSGADASESYWWMRSCSRPSVTIPDCTDDRMPQISGNRRLHIACRLVAGKYSVGCADIRYTFTVSSSGMVDFL